MRLERGDTTASLARARARMRMASAAVLLIGAISLPAVGADAAEDRQASRLWSSIFELVRPTQELDSRQVIVRFDGPSLSEVVAASDRPLSAKQQKRTVERTRKAQHAGLKKLRRAGYRFDVRYRYTKVLNGVSLTLHDDAAQQLRQERGIAAVTEVKSVYPAAAEKADVAAGGAAERAVSPEAPAAEAPTVSIAVLDTGIDFNHPFLAGTQGGPGYDAVSQQFGVQTDASDTHGTQVASAALVAAGTGSEGSPRITLDSVRVLRLTPVAGNFEAVVGRTDALVAGFEHAADPDHDDSVSDRSDVVLASVSVPYGGFADAPEMLAAEAAHTLGSVVVAAAGNDGSSGDEVGTVGSPAAAEHVIAVGAADLRALAPQVDVHFAGGLLDTVISQQPLLTAPADTLPKGRLRVVAVEGAAREVVDYLGADARSRVTGAVALITRRDGVLLGDQVRAAADAGAVAVLVRNGDAYPAAGVVQGSGVSIPAVGMSEHDGSILHEVAGSADVTAELAVAQNHDNTSFGDVAGFSSQGPRYDGIARPDVVAAGVAVPVATVASGGTTAHGDATYTTATGTSVAAADVAGRVAAIRALRPRWSPDQIRAAVIGSAKPVATQGGTLPVRAQGAGVVDVEAALSMPVIARPARIEFGVVTPGTVVTQKLAFIGTADGRRVMFPMLLSDTASPMQPVVSPDGIALQVPADAASGVYDGWLISEVGGVRVPWTLVVRAADELVVPVSAALSRDSFSASESVGDYASHLDVTVGAATGLGDSLGLSGAAAIRVSLERAGTRLGQIGRLDNVLPGTYSFGLSGMDPHGAALKAGTYRIVIETRTAARADAPWQQTSEVAFRVTR